MAASAGSESLPEVPAEDPGYTLTDLEQLGVSWFRYCKTPTDIKSYAGYLNGKGAYYNDSDDRGIYYALYEVPYRDLPKHLHEKHPMIIKSIKWRLNIGK
jgi:hypothetical protein